MKRGFVIALLGAESTGKTTLARELCDALAAPGRSMALVPEFLREFCENAGRTPRWDEQAGIATEQTRRIRVAAERHDIVIADTTAMMIAVYSDQVFGDVSLYPRAESDHRRADLTLLTALDLPWQADGLQRDGPQVRVPLDARVRAALGRAGAAYSVVSGQGPARLAAALACVERSFGALAAPADAGLRWSWCCERCGDVDCERRPLLPRV